MPRPLSFPPRSAWTPLVDLALAEDLGPGDITSEILIPDTQEALAQIEARADLVVCGLAVAEEIFRRIDPELHFDTEWQDGQPLGADSVIARISGRLRGILAAERTALNFLGRMCGIASFTRRFVERTAGTETAIVDTRKTLPGWRALDKYATAVGGCVNHRFGLYDGILIKDNHIAAAGGVAAAVKVARERAPAGLRVQVEVQSEAEAEEACGAGADFLLLDNCSPQAVRGIVQRFREQALLETSGGIRLDNLREYVAAGVSRISIGALTHSAPAADVALEILPGEVTGRGGVSE